MRRSFACIAYLLLSGCEADTITLEIEFPSERSFLLSERIEVDVVRERECAEAVLAVTADPGRIAASGSGSACDARAGRIRLESLPHGTVAFVVRGFHASASPTEPILRGCRIVTIDRTTRPSVGLVLDYTSVYFPYETSVIAAGGPTCPTASDVCDGTCTP